MTRIHKDTCLVYCVDSLKVSWVHNVLPETVDVLAFKALSDETRLRVTMALAQEELCVCEVVELFSTSVQKASHHLRYLKRAGMASMRRDGKLVYYRLHPNASAFIKAMLEWQGRCDSNDDANCTG